MVLGGGSPADATQWVIQPLPAVRDGTLVAVSCASSASCTAVGNYSGPAGVQLPLVERRDGDAWSVQTAVIPHGASSALLTGVSCPSSTNCVAVGYSTYTFTVAGGTTGEQVTLAEHWDGSAWSIQPTPNPAAVGANGQPQASLAGVSCTSSTDCTAVGTYTGWPPQSDNVYVYTLAEHWDGARWTIEPTPTPSGLMPDGLADGGSLLGVSCTSSIACSGVGHVELYGATLAQRWDGTQWSGQPTNDPANSGNNYFDGVSCPTLVTCVAVGDFTQDINDYVDQFALAESWDGKSWSSTHNIPTPPGATHTAGIISGLRGVSCISSADCTAVGDFMNGSNVDLALVEGWNGSTWVFEPSPTPAEFNYVNLFAVSCPTATACTAVGGYGGPGGVFPIVETGSGPPPSPVPAPRTPVRIDNHFTVSHLAIQANGKISVFVKVPGAGRVDLLATA